MLNLMFLAGLGAALTALFWWGFRTLPEERWQFLACAATERAPGGAWAGVNFTYYGFFSALAYTSAAALFLTLAAASGVGRIEALATVATVVAICVPASNWLVRLVEGKRYGFTVGGATFVGFLATPLAAGAVDAVSLRLGGGGAPVLSLLAAMAVAYAFGEAIGRLACISFGCCYGKPVTETRGWVRRVAARFPFVFAGDTKKAAFASRLGGTAVVPIQAMTAIVLGVVGWGGAALYLAGDARAAFGFAAAGSQLWRIYSETLRADYRGEGRISAYQYMAASSTALAIAFAVWGPEAGEPARPDLAAGLGALGTPLTILFLEALFALIFWKMGRSTQTGSTIAFHVRADRI